MNKCFYKVIPLALMLGSARLLLGAPSLLAGDNSGFYLSTEAGLNLENNLTLSGSSGSYSFNPGVAWDVSAGYAFRLSDQFTLGPEVQAGIIYNSMDKLGSYSVNGSITQVPVMGGAVLKWHFCPHWIAYGGGGAGCDFNSFSVTSYNGISISGTTTTSEDDFAWQLTAGIRYQFGSSEIGLGYKYLSFKASGFDMDGNSMILASYTFCF